MQKRIIINKSSLEEYTIIKNNLSYLFIIKEISYKTNFDILYSGQYSIIYIVIKESQLYLYNSRKEIYKKLKTILYFNNSFILFIEENGLYYEKLFSIYLKLNYNAPYIIKCFNIITVCKYIILLSSIYTLKNKLIRINLIKQLKQDILKKYNIKKIIEYIPNIRKDNEDVNILIDYFLNLKLISCSSIELLLDTPITKESANAVFKYFNS